MFERKIIGMFGSDPLAASAGKGAIKPLKPLSMFGPGNNGLPPFESRKGLYKSPFNLDLIEFSKWQEKGVPFLKTAEDFVDGRPLSPEFMRVIRIGMEYHRHGLEGIFYELAASGLQTEILVPKITEIGNIRRVELPANAEKFKGFLHAIVNSKILPDGQVIFEGLANLEGKGQDSTKLRLVGIAATNGQAFFHPDFIPYSDTTIAINRLVPPQNKSLPKKKSV